MIPKIYTSSNTKAIKDHLKILQIAAPFNGSVVQSVPIILKIPVRIPYTIMPPNMRKTNAEMSVSFIFVLFLGKCRYFIALTSINALISFEPKNLLL